ncbi:glutamate synthase-related protein [Metallibacterium scheffleri]|uniref:glutamate synthase-related protein n=1 Tax=Metallibacterium scheffleri TaxID=993689 RepID=UPI0023F53C35|nr:glutamate synthase-related protein [Metallibacterium scheffleri]
MPQHVHPVPLRAGAGLYRPGYEHDACGVGFVAHIKGQKSHAIVRDGLAILHNLDHRGAVGADALMGDGAGILMQIPDALYREDMSARGIRLPPPGEYGVGMVFLPREPASRAACEQEIERAVRALDQRVLGWREVPVDRDMPMSPAVRAREPVIRQVFIGRGAQVRVADALERQLYVIRKTASHAIRALGLRHGTEYFVPSMSTRTVVYKGLLLADQVGQYYRDLADARAVSALALVHQRFSTNTFPEWALAHPYRLVAHNGEINTVRGNYNWMRAREGAVHSPLLGADLQRLWPLIYPEQSDTACFDNVLELLLMAGYPLAQAMMMMIPEAWEQHAHMDPRRRAFYEYHAAMMEPWDGPAAIAFTDGRQIGATLDRNGLRPARYILTDDERVILASEVGVLPVPESRIVRKWRLQPGRMLLIDTDAGRIIDDDELKAQLASARPYRQWVEALRVRLDALDAPQAHAAAAPPPDDLAARQHAFGYSSEDLRLVLAPMALNAEEAIGSMGDDAPLAVLSQRVRPLYAYFRQRFAQVTNPPIDPIREQLVMSLLSFIGPKPDLLDINQVNPPLRLEVAQPILDFAGMARLRQIARISDGKFRSYTLDICYPAAWGAEGIEARLASLCAEAVDALGSGHNILIVSDCSQDAARVAIPALLATSALHQHLIARGLRTQTGLVVETGSAREVHDFACLAGYGAEAVHPYLALHTVAALLAQLGEPGAATPSAEQAQRNYIKAIGKGLLKVMSKMGISTFMSYCGAQCFETIGLAQTLVDQYFSGTLAPVDGVDVFALGAEALRLHHAAWTAGAAADPEPGPGGDYAWRAQGEHHLWSPDAVAKLQHAVRSGHGDTYRDYAALINEHSRQLLTLRGLLEFGCDAAGPVALDEIEPAASIVTRFSTGAMSLGSISTEAHATLALAMNRIGGRSNTGEGGEDPARYRAELQGGPGLQDGDTLLGVLGGEAVVADQPLRAGDSLRSRIKQVASARFGVSAEYLASAEQIQIKMAQGAKPGEGGQLPGSKVSDYIGFLRHAVPGVGLISPPPHHDIYSIEDLAQLIHDLKNVNPRASISVKLVSETGVGTIAAGVAKAKADHVVIAGHDGGTGAAPLSSIKRVGAPWEIGLAETQQTLVQNGLRGRIRVQVDGQLRTGRDVVIAALLGADEFGFATAPLVAAGCIMMRKCHLNTCPVGIATQDPRLRKLFSGTPEHVINYFFFLAEEVRGLMAQLGVRRFEDLVGRVELLHARANVPHWKAHALDLKRVLAAPGVGARRHESAQDHGLGQALDNKLVERARAALEQGERVHFIQDVRNVNRSVGAMLSGEVARRFGSAGLPDDTLHIQMEGSGGQSFAAFLAHGITLYLIGDANDYTGKGLSGGRVVVRPSIDFRGEAQDNIIVGNAVLYGATAGEAFLRGVAGERFAVRNSGASAVVEGCGDHGCEYMTGGSVLVLGASGRNFAAGMSGGVAYVLDVDGAFAQRCNTAMVTLERVLPEAAQIDTLPRALWHGGESDEACVRRLLEAHHRWTGSLRARELLQQWETARARFVKVFPHEYRRALGDLAARHETAQQLARASSAVE